MAGRKRAGWKMRAAALAAFALLVSLPAFAQVRGSNSQVDYALESQRLEQESADLSASLERSRSTAPTLAHLCRVRPKYFRCGRRMVAQNDGMGVRLIRKSKKSTAGL